VQSLILEIEQSNLTTENTLLKTLYFWGWTPWVLSSGQLERIIKSIEKKYWFDDSIEINLETTPFNVTPENIQAWEKLWINRVSMWVQTLNNDALKEIQRGNKWNIFTALDNLKDTKINNISIDFILWLPYVQKWEILEDIKFILEKYNFITHISVYMLEEYYEPDMIIESKYDNITYPDNWKNMWLKDEDFSLEYSNIKIYLQKQWFGRYEISNYAKPWFECQHNISYWNHKEVVSFWLWAYWYINKTRYRNSDNFSDYYARKNIISEKNNSNDLFLEKVMFSLRTLWINRELEKKLDQEKIKYFLDEKYLIRKNNLLQLSDNWVTVMDYILSEII
jgi:oxygen-independent coproporphyrinogen III oxidase